MVAVEARGVGVEPDVLTPSQGSYPWCIQAVAMTGTELRRLRRRLRLTQRELAARAGVHWNTIARQERDEVRITEPMARLYKLLATTVPTTEKGGRRR